MGRYSSVQTYSDQHNTRSTSYEQERATSGGTLQTEKVHNPYGSTAGAGSGEFHIYRHARAREQQRLKALDEAEEEQTEDAQFQEKIQEWKNEEEKRLEKKRKKRAREKAAKLRKKNLVLSGVILGSEGNRADIDGDCNVDSNEEFTYKPIHSQVSNNDTDEPSGQNTTNQKDCEDGTDNSQSSEAKIIGTDCLDEGKPSVEQTLPPFKNDGSFLEMMKKMQQEQVTKEVQQNSE